MNDLISVLIVDDNLDFCTLLNEYIDNTGDMVVKGIANDGVEAVKLITELAPDVVVLDIIMPNLDGIGVLEKLSESSVVKRPIFIVLTAIGKDAIVRNAIELGADYYVMKPFDMDVLALHIRELYERKAYSISHMHTVQKGRGALSPIADDNSIEQVVTGIITSIGITPNLAGYRILREAVVLSVIEPSALNSIPKRVYPILAERNQMTARNIDRAIRCAISSAWKKSKSDKYSDKITTIFSNAGKTPGNTLVIRFLAEKTMQMMHMTYNEQK